MWIISETLELRVEGGRISYSWCMCVGNHGYHGFGGGMDGCGEYYANGTKPGGSHVLRYRSSSRVWGENTDVT